jgi:hypothetical protein
MLMVLFETALPHDPFPVAVSVSVLLPAAMSAGLGV